MRPPDHVLAAFGVRGVPRLLTGGIGPAWRVGDAVLKPLDGTPEGAAAVAEILGRVPPDPRFRLARPRRSVDGSLVVDGWLASDWVPGRCAPEWRAIIKAGEAFHAALAAEPRPAFLDARRDPWAVADRVAWGEQPLGSGAPAVLRELAADLGPANRARSQLVHGDLTGNVLLESGLPPAIIDVSPYWRPPGYATAIVVTDARWFGGADAELAAWARPRTPGFDDLLHRALVFRAVTQWLIRPRSFDRATVERIEALRA
jgi:uncharacterized protein (TIGR02569 family)